MKGKLTIGYPKISEAVNQRTDNTTANRKRTKSDLRNTTHKTND